MRLPICPVAQGDRGSPGPSDYSGHQNPRTNVNNVAPMGDHAKLGVGFCLLGSTGVQPVAAVCLGQAIPVLGAKDCIQSRRIAAAAAAGGTMGYPVMCSLRFCLSRGIESHNEGHCDPSISPSLDNCNSLCPYI